MTATLVGALAALLMTTTLGLGADRSEDSTMVRPPVLRIQTDVDSALVILDGQPVGRTPLTLDSLSPGSHVVEVRHPDLDRWAASVVYDTIQVDSGSAITLVYQMRLSRLVQSDPFGADVYVGEKLIGSTPLVLHQQVDEIIVSLRKPGYSPATVRREDFSGQSILVKLDPLAGVTSGQEVVFRNGASKEDVLSPAIVACLSSVAFGAASAYFKVRADNAYSEYLLSGDSETRSRVRRLDTAAGVLLVAAQAGLSVFTYFLLSP